MYKLKDLVHESIKGSERKLKTVSKASELALMDVERDGLTTFESFPNVDISNLHPVLLFRLQNKDSFS